MDRKDPPALNLESLQDGASASYEASQSASSSSRYDPIKELTEDYERKLASVEEEKRSLIEEKNEALTRSQRDREAVQRKDEEIDGLHQDIASLESRLEELHKENRAMQKSHEAELKRLNDDLAEMAEYKERYTSISKQLDRYRAKIDEMGDQQSRIESLQAELNEKTKEVMASEKKDEELTLAEKQIEDLKTSMAQTTAELITARTSKSVLDKEVEELRQKLQQLEREKNALALQVSVQEESKSYHGEKSVNLGGDNVKDLKMQVLRLENQLQTLKEHDTEAMSKTIIELRQQLDVAEKTKAILQSKLEEALTRASSIGGTPGGSNVHGDEMSEDFRELLDKERAKQLAMHEVYSRVIHRLALKVKEKSILLGELPSKAMPS